MHIIRINEKQGGVILPIKFIASASHPNLNYNDAETFFATLPWSSAYVYSDARWRVVYETQPRASSFLSLIELNIFFIGHRQNSLRTSNQSFNIFYYLNHLITTHKYLHLSHKESNTQHRNKIISECEET